MKRWAVPIVLLLSVGINLGLIAGIAVRRLGREPAAAAQPFGQPAAQPSPAPEDIPGPETAGPGLMPGEPPPGLPRLADRLGLDGERRRRFLEVQWEFFQRANGLRREQGELHREMRRELTAAQPDRRRVERLLQESARIHLAQERALAENVLASRELLDARQEREFLRFLSRLRAGGSPQGPAGRPGDRPPRRPAPWRDRRP